MDLRLVLAGASLGLTSGVGPGFGFALYVPLLGSVNFRYYCYNRP